MSPNLRDLLVASIGVDASAVEAGVAVPVVVALVHVDVAVRSVEALSAGAPVPVGEGLAGRSVATGLRRAVVRLLTCFT